MPTVHAGLRPRSILMLAALGLVAALRAFCGNDGMRACLGQSNPFKHPLPPLWSAGFWPAGEPSPPAIIVKAWSLGFRKAPWVAPRVGTSVAWPSWQTNYAFSAADRYGVVIRRSAARRLPGRRIPLTESGRGVLGLDDGAAGPSQILPGISSRRFTPPGRGSQRRACGASWPGPDSACRPFGRPLQIGAYVKMERRAGIEPANPGWKPDV